MNSLRLGFATLLAVVMTTTAFAQNTLDPAFRVVRISGDCQVSLADGDGYQPAEESKAYPYGTAIQTGPRSSLVIVLSEGNIVRVLANASLTMDENTNDPKIKNVRLTDGEIEVDLNKNFHKGGNKLNVETATAICGAVGTKFRVASRKEQDMRIILFRVIEGIVEVYGDNFEVTELDANDWLSVLSPEDRSFLRLQNMQGEFDIRIKDQEMNNKDLPTEKGNVLKVWQRRVPGTNERVVTAQLTAPDGTIVEEVTVTIGGAGATGPIFRPGEDQPPVVDQPIPTDGGENPLPPEDIMQELVDRITQEENVEFRPGTPSTRPPATPTPTPVGRR